MSAHLDDAIIEQARRDHAFSILSKPVKLRQIINIVRQALQTTYNWRAGGGSELGR